MGLIRNCIVINNGKFEALSFDISGGIPLNHILLQPDGKTTSNKYICIDNEVVFSWEDSIYTGPNGIFKITFKKEVLFDTQFPKIPVVIDALNKYKTLSKEGLNTLVQENQEKEKSSLELEIEKLKDEKQKLITGAKTYAEFIKKGNELLSLMNELNNEK